MRSLFLLHQFDIMKIGYKQKTPEIISGVLFIRVVL